MFLKIANSLLEISRKDSGLYSFNELKINDLIFPLNTFR